MNHSIWGAVIFLEILDPENFGGRFIFWKNQPKWVGGANSRGGGYFQLPGIGNPLMGFEWFSLRKKSENFQNFFEVRKNIFFIGVEKKSWDIANL